MHWLSDREWFLHHAETKTTHMPRDRHRFPSPGASGSRTGRARATSFGTTSIPADGYEGFPAEPAGLAGRCTGRLSGHRDNYGRIFAPLHAFSRKAFILHQLPQGKHLNHPPDIPGSYNRRKPEWKGQQTGKKSPVSRQKCSRNKHPDTVPEKQCGRTISPVLQPRREVYT